MFGLPNHRYTNVQVKIFTVMTRQLNHYFGQQQDCGIRYEYNNNQWPGIGASGYTVP